MIPHINGFGLPGDPDGWSARELCAHPWTLTLGTGEVRAPHLGFLPDGRIAGVADGGLKRWSFEPGRLVLTDPLDQRVAEFDSFVTHPGRPMQLLGRGRDGMGGEPWSLLARERIGFIPPTAPDLVSKLRAARRRRRNLVVVRVDERSLHPSWTADDVHDDRSWDLCVSHYGADETFGQDPLAEYQFLQNDVRKWQAVHALFYEGSPLWNYDRIAFPDDDLATSWRDINLMFSICEEFGLDLAQPALRGYTTHSITRPNPAFVLRFTSFVEGIAAWFTPDALRTCLPTFPGTSGGYGLDHIWPKLLGEPRDRLAVVDCVHFEHTRPVATTYNMQDSLDEGWGYQMLYAAYPKQVVYGGVFAQPEDLFLKW